MRNSNRIHYVDILRGILIILVVVHHAPLVAERIDNTNPYMKISYLYDFTIGFTMPGFFLMTGYLSNFDRDFIPFFKRCLKTIALPCFCLYYLNHWLSDLYVFLFSDDSHWVTWKHFFSLGIRTFVREGGYYWFLSAMFISKVLYWFVHNWIKDYKYILLFTFILFVLGTWLEENHCGENFFFYRQGFARMFFLPIGALLRKYHESYYKFVPYLGVFYVLLVLLLIYLHVDIPLVTRVMTVRLATIPLYLGLAISGSLFVLWTCEMIGKCKLLEYMGQGSLVIYAFNYMTLCIVSTILIQHFKPVRVVESILIFVLIIIVSLIILTFFYWVLNHKYLKIILGKF